MVSRKLDCDACGAEGSIPFEHDPGATEERLEFCERCDSEFKIVLRGGEVQNRSILANKT